MKFVQIVLLSAFVLVAGCARNLPAQNPVGHTATTAGPMCMGADCESVAAETTPTFFAP